MPRGAPETKVKNSSEGQHPSAPGRNGLGPERKGNQEAMVTKLPCMTGCNGKTHCVGDKKRLGGDLK